MWTKRQIIDAALTEIGMGEYAFDVQPEDLQDVLLRLDAMIAQWEGKGIVTGYVVVNDPTVIAIAGDSGIAQNLVWPVIANLAVVVAPMYGKQPSPQSLKAAREGYATALNTIPLPKKLQNVTNVPAGAGYRERFTHALPPDEVTP